MAKRKRQVSFTPISSEHIGTKRETIGPQTSDQKVSETAAERLERLEEFPQIYCRTRKKPVEMDQGIDPSAQMYCDACSRKNGPPKGQIHHGDADNIDQMLLLIYVTKRAEFEAIGKENGDDIHMTATAAICGYLGEARLQDGLDRKASSDKAVCRQIVLRDHSEAQGCQQGHEERAARQQGHGPRQGQRLYRLLRSVRRHRPHGHCLSAEAMEEDCAFLRHVRAGHRIPQQLQA